MEQQVKAIIGDYQDFFSDLLQRLTASGIAVQGMPLVQLLYRTATMPEYEKVRDNLKTYCREFVETDFNGRPIAILILKIPLNLGWGFTVDMIELAAPRPAHMYPSGLESVGIFVGKKLPAFKKRYKKVLTGIKDHGMHCKPAFITFANGKTVKFYDKTLKEIVLLQGWRFEQLEQKADSHDNQLAHFVNAWLSYVMSIKNWRDVIKRIPPNKSGCGAVYEIGNPINRLDEDMAIVDMRKLRFTEPHYHPDNVYEMYIVLEGSGQILLGKKEQEIQKESVILIPPNMAHVTFPHKNLVIAAVNKPAFKQEDYVVLIDSNKKVGFDKSKFEELLKKK